MVKSGKTISLKCWVLYRTLFITNSGLMNEMQTAANLNIRRASDVLKKRQMFSPSGTTQWHHNFRHFNGLRGFRLKPVGKRGGN
jgi:hypothetical protein